MKVTEFFLGFGPRLWSFRRGETEYGVKALPAGGYVRIIGMTNMEEVDPADEPRTFRAGPPPQPPRHHPRRRHRQPDHRVRPVLRGHRRSGPRRRRSQHHRRAQSSPGARPHERRAPDRRPGRRRRREAGRRAGTTLKSVIERNGGTAITITVVRDGQRSTSGHAEDRQDGQGFLGVGPRNRRARRDRARGGARDRSTTMGKVLTGIDQHPRPTVLAVGREHVGAENFTSATPKAGSQPRISNRPMSLMGIVDHGQRPRRRQPLVARCSCSARSASSSRCSTCCRCCRSTAATRSVVVYEWIASKVRHRRVYGRLPQADPRQRGAADPDPVPRAVVDGPRHPPARPVAGCSPRRHRVASRDHAPRRRRGRWAAARRCRCSR